MSKNNQSRSGARFNLFDVILILALIACIGGIVSHVYFISDLNEQQSDRATIAFSVSGVSERTAETFCVTDCAIYSSENDHLLGSLVTAAYTNQALSIEAPDGSLVTVTHPDKMDITGDMSLTGTWSEDGFLIDGITLATVGKTISVYTNGAVCTVTITGVYPQLQKK